MAAPIGKQFASTMLMLALTVTLPFWILPVAMWKLYRYSYEEICGWDDF